MPKGGEKPIRLPSEGCEVQFHVTSKVDVPLLDDTTAKRREMSKKFEKGSHSPRKQKLPAGEMTINLPSEECTEQFHPSSKTDMPLLDETTAKRRKLMSKFDKGSHSPRQQVLPAGETAIPLPSEECEQKFHPSGKTDVPLLDDMTAKRRKLMGSRLVA